MKVLALALACIVSSLTWALPDDPARQVTQAAFPELHPMDFLVGDWDFHATFRTQNGEGQATYRSHVSYTLDGKAILDTFCNVLPDGSFDPQGSTVRTYDRAAKKWRMVFYGAKLDYVTEFEGEFEDGEFHFEGKGHQGAQEYLERVTFHDIEADSYSWSMDRSYDDGATWIERFFRYDAVRAKPQTAGESR